MLVMNDAPASSSSVGSVKQVMGGGAIAMALIASKGARRKPCMLIIVCCWLRDEQDFCWYDSCILNY
jgi:hypothetical protein